MTSIEDIRTRVLLKKDHIRHASSSDFPNNYPGYDDSYNFEKFKKSFKVHVVKNEDLEIEFDLIGIDPSIANAFRRICIAEVPTMAIEKVFIYDSNGIMYDEIFAQRVGLVPLKVDPRKFDWKEGTPTDLNTIVFNIDVTCKKNPEAKQGEEDPLKKYEHSQVLSKDIVWNPEGDQAEKFEQDPISVMYDDIVITRLNVGQTIKGSLHAIKGIGREHAKWSPVATCSYRIMPEITILKPITDDDAYKFQKCFIPGVIVVEKVKGIPTARVANARKDTVSRECLRHPEFEDKVKLTRLRNHFIFSIESTGAYKSAEIFEEACLILESKCDGLLQALANLGP